LKERHRLVATGFLAVLLSAVLAIGTPVQAQNSQVLLDAGSRAYSYLAAIFLEQGLAPPNSARPWSLEELRFELERVDPTCLSSAGRHAYEYLKSLLGAPEIRPALQVSMGAILTPEVFVRSQLTGNHVLEDSYHWVHGYEERRSLLEFPLEFWLGDGFYAVSVFAAKEEHATTREPDNFSNLLVDDPNVRLDLYFPFKAYASVGGQGWSFRFGRDSLSWGNGHTGNLVLSDWSDFYDYLGLNLFGDRIKLSSVYAVLDPFDPKSGHVRNEYSAFMGHRLDILLHERLRLTLNEAMSFGGPYQPELVRDTNTFMIFHNWMIPERTNSVMAFEVDYTPWRWFSLYGQLAVDEFPTKYEEDRTGGGGPPVMAYIAGVSGYYPLEKSYLELGVEWALTSPWLYNRRDSPYYYNVRRYWSLTTDDWEYVVKPIGYRYGPDAMVWNAHVSWDLPGGPAALLELTHITKGRKTIDDEWDPVTGESTPSGDTPEKAFVLKLDGRYPLSNRLEAGAGIVLNTRWNIGHLSGNDSMDLECNLYLKASF
jgi:hypothetical protein